MIYLVSGLLTGGVLTAICWPLFSRGEAVETAILEETEWDLLQRKKEVVLGNIQDLDFEFKCGKLSSADHARVRAELVAEMSAVFEAIDKLEETQDLDTLIRREIDSRRRRKPKTTGVCPSCRHRNSEQNKFCSECGSRLAS